MDLRTSARSGRLFGGSHVGLWKIEVTERRCTSGVLMRATARGRFRTRGKVRRRSSECLRRSGHGGRERRGCGLGGCVGVSAPAIRWGTSASASSSSAPCAYSSKCRTSRILFAAAPPIHDAAVIFFVFIARII
jgi:hypothetical protein